MADMTDRLERFINALLENRRPPRFHAGPEDGEALRVAAMLGAAFAGARDPAPAFVERLHARLASTPETRGNAGVTRRRLIRRLGIPGAAALVGVAAGAVLRELSEDSRGSASGGPELVPADVGAWQAVTTLEALTVGQPMLFTVGAIRGFLIKQSDAEVVGVSAVCTHLGCLLAATPDSGRLDCPCHGAAFALDGAPLNPDYTTPLPRLQTRVIDGTVEVFAV
jgi:Rieske Fe-S protein